MKLVRDPAVAAKYLGPLSDAVSKVASGAAFPEVRAFAQEAEVVLKAAGGGVIINGEANENGAGDGVEDKDGLDEDVFIVIVKSMPQGWIVKPKFELPGRPLLISHYDSEAHRRVVWVYRPTSPSPRIPANLPSIRLNHGRRTRPSRPSTCI